MGLFAHHPRRAGNLVYGLPFHSHGRQDRGNLERSRLAGHDLIHDIDRFRLGKIDPVDELLYRLPNIHTAG